jgi:hypothetical protein
MPHVVADELMQIGPILPVEAGDIVPVEGGEGGFRHGANLTRGVTHSVEMNAHVPLLFSESESASGITIGDRFFPSPLPTVRLSALAATEGFSPCSYLCAYTLIGDVNRRAIAPQRVTEKGA